MDGISDGLDALQSLPGDLHPHLAKGKRPPHGSVSSKELTEAKSSPEMSSLIVGATKLAAAKLDAAKDQIKALALLQDDLSLKFARAGPARSILEASSAVIWLLGGDEGAQHRAQRFVRLKRGELKEERKLANVQGELEQEDPEVRNAMREAIEISNEEIKGFEKLVHQLELESLDPISQTDLIRETLDMEFEYRLYSNLAHSAGFVILHMQHIFAESDKDNAAEAW